MIYGKRIRLRKVERNDLINFTEWLNDDEVRAGKAKYLPLTLSDSERWFDFSHNRSSDEHPFAIEADTVEGWRLIGYCWLFRLNGRVRSAEYELVIGDKNYWNQGYGTETTFLVINHAFENLNLNRIGLEVHTKNSRARRVYEKCGFKHEGTLRQAEYLQGTYVDIELMSIIREDWLKLINSE